MLSNWKHYKVPGAPLREFLRHEPFPSDELKATYITGLKKPKKKDKKLSSLNALERRWQNGA